MPQNLADEEGVAVGLVVESAGQRGRILVEVMTSGGSDEGGDRFLVETPQHDAVGAVVPP